MVTARNLFLKMLFQICFMCIVFSGHYINFGIHVVYSLFIAIGPPSWGAAGVFGNYTQNLIFARLLEIPTYDQVSLRNDKSI